MAINSLSVSGLLDSTGILRAALTQLREHPGHANQKVHNPHHRGLEGAKEEAVRISKLQGGPALTMKRGEHGAYSDAEESALRAYQGTSYWSINGHLRLGESVYKGVDADVKAIDSAMKKNPIKADVVVYRGTRTPPDPKAREFMDRGFISTSTHNYFRGSRHTMQIKVKAKHPSVWMGGGEFELLLARNTRFTKERDGSWLAHPPV